MAQACFWCDGPMGPPTADHLMSRPLAKLLGIAMRPQDTVPACGQCNLGRGEIASTLGLILRFRKLAVRHGPAGAARRCGAKELPGFMERLAPRRARFRALIVGRLAPEWHPVLLRELDEIEDFPAAEPWWPELVRLWREAEAAREVSRQAEARQRVSAYRHAGRQ